MKIRAWVLFLFLAASVFTLATVLQPRTQDWTRDKGADPLMQVLLGDGRQILANHMFVQADVYFHSGYYPSVFDRTYVPTNAEHMTHPDEHGEHEHGKPGDDAAHEEEEHERAMRFLAEPLDWVERFGRRFAITTHSHLEGGNEREMLPWLRLSAELDPHRVETYTVAAYWLRRDLNKPKEAEQFLREGLTANPQSYEILFELGRLYEENYHDATRARNDWEAALRRWAETEGRKPEPDVLAFGRIAVRLAHLEEELGHNDRALELLRITIAHQASPHPEALRAQMESVQARMKTAAAPH